MNGILYNRIFVTDFLFHLAIIFTLKKLKKPWKILAIKKQKPSWKSALFYGL